MGKVILQNIFDFSKKISNYNFKDKILAYINLFLGIKYGGVDYKYLGDSLSERLKYLSTYDELQYSFDTFDCLTLVETILALCFVKNYSKLNEFEINFLSNLKKIRYKNSVSCFFNRNHFMSLDWIKHNSDLLPDITQNFIKLEEDKNYYKIATAEIDKISWLQKHKALEGISDKDVLSLIDNFEASKIFTMSGFDVSEANIPYIDLDWVLKNYESFVLNTNDFFITYFVRPNWNLKDKIGTSLNISHLGFCVKEKGKEINFYHASSLGAKNVEKIDFRDYLLFCKSIPTLKGINISAINENYIFS